MTKRKLLLGSMLLVGLLQVVTYLWGRRLRSQYLAQEVEPGTFKVVAVTEGKDEKIASQLKGGIIRVLMGGLELDLRDAKLERKPVVVETTVAFGGVDMKGTEGLDH